jgi:hypothetical protein
MRRENTSSLLIASTEQGTSKPCAPKSSLSRAEGGAKLDYLFHSGAAATAFAEPPY